MGNDIPSGDEAAVLGNHHRADYQFIRPIK